MDMDLEANRAMNDIAMLISLSLNTLLFGSYILNAFFNLSMKKLLQAIRVIQMIAFFFLIQVNFTPISWLFLEKIYSFVTFKVIPDQLMSDFLILLGFKEENLTKTAQSTTHRLLQEVDQAI
jgi:hypothetical protein